MARLEKPINPAAPLPVLRIAQGLRVLRHKADKTYRQLSIKCRFSVAALASATSGDALPTRELTLAFVRACGGDVSQWEREWISANAELHGVDKPPSPESIADLAGLTASLTATLRWAGLTSHARIAQASGLSQTTVRRALSGSRIPSCPTLRALLNACQLEDATIQRWLDIRLGLYGLPVSLDEVFDRTNGSVDGTQIANRPEGDLAQTTPTSYEGVLATFAYLYETAGATVMHAELRKDLTRLRRRRGVMSANLPGHLGPTLRAVCGIVETAPIPQQRDLLVHVLDKAVSSLPSGMRDIVAGGLNLPGWMPARGTRDARTDTWSYNTRISVLSELLNLGSSTVQRRLDDALELLIEQLIASAPEEQR